MSLEGNDPVIGHGGRVSLGRNQGGQPVTNGQKDLWGKGRATLAGQAGGLRRVVLALVAIETVAGIIEMHRQFRMRTLNFLDFGRRDVRIFASKMQHDGAARDLDRKSTRLNSSH